MPPAPERDEFVEEPVEPARGDERDRLLQRADLAIEGGAGHAELAGDVGHRRATDAEPGEAAFDGVEHRVELGPGARRHAVMQPAGTERALGVHDGHLSTTIRTLPPCRDETDSLQSVHQV